jgi:FixJ family two-component response regulator
MMHGDHPHVVFITGHREIPSSVQAIKAELLALRAEYAALSLHQREAMALVTSGLLNKQVGGRLGISEITVKVHRGNVMRKMETASLPDLVIKAAKLGIAPTSA